MTEATKTKTAPKPPDEDKFKVWYGDHAEDWNKKRRGRYETDAAYRTLVLERNKKSRALAREARLERQKGEASVRRERSSPRWKEVTIQVEGQPLVLYSVGFVARRLGVSVQAVRLWERNGTIPPPSNAQGREGKDRFYSLDDVEGIRKILIGTGRLEARDDDSATVRVRPALSGQFYEVIYENGKTEVEKLYTVGMLASALGRTVVTLTQRERQGDLPSTPLRGSSVGRRLYTLGMIEVVDKALSKRPWLIRGREAWAEFRAEVLAGWTKLGVMTAKLGALQSASPPPKKTKKAKKAKATKATKKTA